MSGLFNEMKFCLAQFTDATTKDEIEQMRQEAIAADEYNAALNEAELLQFGALLARYNLPLDTGAWDAMEHLETLDHRLSLAIAMERTRNDWSDGFWRVKSAIDEYKAHPDHDPTVAHEIQDILDNEYTDDGRVFRDCEWNYRVLYALIDKQLVEDARFLYKMLPY